MSRLIVETVEIFLLILHNRNYHFLTSDQQVEFSVISVFYFAKVIQLSTSELFTNILQKVWVRIGKSFKIIL